MISYTTQPLLDTIANPQRRRELLETYTDAELETMRERYGNWGPAFPSGATRAHECEEEIARRRATASEGA
jgi:hypothetical protein